MDCQGLVDMDGEEVVEAGPPAGDQGRWIVWGFRHEAFDGFDVAEFLRLGEGCPGSCCQLTVQCGIGHEL